ncbi:hypothetical protein GLOIN_2v1877063 [Rhizophagus clarus]|uniref:Uncharacterized protein n=1 Tax=Rhizophagus clarus TaxID=94130 RepID=A0A8H3QYC1_9GLOM|nr:hypothetical protein GLOIN_2v1877063 [Rhizophagus clarus]
MNETGMSSGKWYRFNRHLKSLITEQIIAIEHKGLETLGKILDHPDTPEVVMTYLLSCNLTNWSSEKIPVTKMKKEIMQDQLPNPV